MKTLIWSPLTRQCTRCDRRFRLSWDAVTGLADTAAYRRTRDSSPADVESQVRAITLGDIADLAQWCLHCVAGSDAPPEEFVEAVEGRKQ